MTGQSWSPRVHIEVVLPARSKFWEIARAKGSASQDKKQAIIQALIVASRPRTNEAGVIIRAMLVSGM